MMTLRFTDEKGRHKVVSAEKIELEDVYNCSVKNGRWTFECKEGEQLWANE